MKTKNLKEPAYVAQTLAWCNERRKEQGKEPLEHLPKGVRFDGDSCPCGQACGCHVSRFHFARNADEAYYGGESQRPLPIPVRDFVNDFDDGKLPQYVA